MGKIAKVGELKEDMKKMIEGLRGFFSPRVVGRTIRVKRGKGAVLFSNPSNKRRFVFGVGSGLFLLGLLFLFFLYYPLLKALYNYRFGRFEAPPTLSEEKGTKKEKVRVDYSDFFISIPKIKAKSKIIANVPATDKKVYMKALKEGVAHARGTAFPGEGKLIYLFAHSTNAPYNVVRYNAVFFLLNKLEKDDEIFIRFSGRLYRYRVVEKKIVGASNTESVYFPDTEEILILQTCWPPGTTWKRLLVAAKPFSGM